MNVGARRSSEEGVQRKSVSGNGKPQTARVTCRLVAASDRPVCVMYTSRRNASMLSYRSHGSRGHVATATRGSQFGGFVGAGR